MSSSNFADFSKLFFEKFWEIYKLTDEKRIKSFYYMLAIILIFLLFLLGKENNTLDFMGNQVERNAAMIVFPAMIFLLSLRYFYISVLSLSNHNKFNHYFEITRQFWKESIEKENEQLAEDFGSNFHFDNFKSQDISELPNLLIIPAQVAKYNRINKNVRVLLQIFMTIFYGILHCSAILLFLFLTIHYENSNAISYYLIVLQSMLVIFLSYSFFRAKEIIKELKN